MKQDALYWIKKLNLIPHPEGGLYSEIYRSPNSLARETLSNRFQGPRALSSSIYYLLDKSDFSCFHRLLTDEIWHYYHGCSLTIYSINPQGILSQIFLGNDIEKGEVFQAVVPAGCWFGARVNHPQEYSLVGCTMSPGFDFADFEIANRAALTRQFPQHEKIIRELTRESFTT